MRIRSHNIVSERKDGRTCLNFLIIFHSDSEYIRWPWNCNKTEVNILVDRRPLAVHYERGECIETVKIFISQNASVRFFAFFPKSRERGEYHQGVYAKTKRQQVSCLHYSHLDC